MSKRIRDLYLLTMYLLSFAGVAFLVFSRMDGVWPNLFFAAFWLFSFTIRNLFLYNTDSYAKLGLLTYIADIVCLMIAGIVVKGVPAALLFCITLADCFITWGLGYGAVCLLLILAADTVKSGTAGQLNLRDILIVIYHEMPILLVTGLIAYLVGRVLKSSVLLEDSIKEVEEREVKLRAAYYELNQAYKSLEEMATLKERNRIAREIHDTVGHTLTNVIVELEAGKMTAEKDPKASKGKYDMAHDQAVKALNEMRYSVRMLADKENTLDLRLSLESVLEGTKVHSGMAIKYMIDLPSGFKSSVDDMIIRALKEGISNGIRHGGATAIFFRLYIQNDSMHFLLQDNGSGAESLILGFGLRNMKDGIESAGGSIAFATECGEGFEIEINMPLVPAGRYNNGRN